MPNAKCLNVARAFKERTTRRGCILCTVPGVITVANPRQCNHIREGAYTAFAGIGRVQPQRTACCKSKVKRLAQMNESLMGSKSKSKYKHKRKSNKRKSTLAKSRHKSHGWHISNMAEVNIMHSLLQKPHKSATQTHTHTRMSPCLSASLFPCLSLVANWVSGAAAFLNMRYTYALITNICIYSNRKLEMKASTSWRLHYVVRTTPMPANPKPRCHPLAILHHALHTARSSYCLPVWHILYYI